MDALATTTKTRCNNGLCECGSSYSFKDGRDEKSWSPGDRCAVINAHIQTAEKLKDLAEAHYAHAGRHIAEIKRQCPNAWQDMVKGQCGIGRSRAYELMKIAEGSRTLEEIRARTNERTQKSLKKQRASANSGQAADNVIEMPRRKARKKKMQPRAEHLADEQAHCFIRHLLEFHTDFSNELRVWHQTEPELSKEMKAALIDRLHTVANDLTVLAQMIDGS